MTASALSNVNFAQSQRHHFAWWSNQQHCLCFAMRCTLEFRVPYHFMHYIHFGRREDHIIYHRNDCNVRWRWRWFAISQREQHKGWMNRECAAQNYTYILNYPSRVWVWVCMNQRQTLDSPEFEWLNCSYMRLTFVLLCTHTPHLLHAHTHNTHAFWLNFVPFLIDRMCCIYVDWYAVMWHSENSTDTLSYLVCHTYAIRVTFLCIAHRNEFECLL